MIREKRLFIPYVHEEEFVGFPESVVLWKNSIRPTLGIAPINPHSRFEKERTASSKAEGPEASSSGFFLKLLSISSPARAAKVKASLPLVLRHDHGENIQAFPPVIMAQPYLLS